MSTESDAADDVVEFRQAPAELRLLPSRLLNQAATQADRLVTDGLAALGARKWHYAVLLSLATYGPGSQATLSRRTGVYRSDMVAVLNELAERGAIERTPDPDDRRRNVVTITDQGRVQLASMREVVAGLQGELLAPLSQAERDHLVDLLSRLVDHHLIKRPLAE